MKLSLKTIKSGEFSEKGYNVPKFDIAKIASKTVKNPTWIHFGAGNIFRAFPARICGELIEKGEWESGIIVCETFDEEIVDKAFAPYDNLTLAVSLKGDGSMDKNIVASIVESVKYSENYSRLKEIFTSPSLQMATLTITEKGYAQHDGDGNILGYLASDFDNMQNLKSVPAIIAKLLYERYLEAKLPMAIVSMDNCSHNGTILKNSVLAIANSWHKNEIVPDEFIEYLNDEFKITFNWTMIDKITPRPADAVLEMLKADGFEGAELVKTSKNTFVSAFVNAEECEYLAIEDKFPNGRPPLEKGGVIFGDKETIDRIEKMKVCTCLNPLHTALAIFGSIMGHTSISGEMADATLNKLVNSIGYVEGMPVVVDPVIMSAEQFISDCLEKRFPNPFVPDTPQRIACDTSKKLPVRFGETLKAYIAKGETDLSFLKYIPLVFAGWARYLMAVDDNGEKIELSPDPNLEKFTKYVEGITLGGKNDYSTLKNIFSSEEIFGVDLYAHNLGEICETYFISMASGAGMVRSTLDSVLFE